MDFDFDILPAANFTKGLRLDTINIQQQRVLAEIKRDPKKGYMYSSSLAEAATRFMTKQNGFANEMVRIAKFWFKTLHFDKYPSGAKYCIELIAVYAANKEEDMPAKLHLRSFARFIEYLRKFENLNIDFEQNKYQVLNGPRVMDPANPYNNLAKNWDRKSIGSIKGYADETSKRLHSLANSGTLSLNKLFVPQPEYRPDIREIFKYSPTRSQWLLETVTFSSLPDLKIRNECFHPISNDFNTKQLNCREQ